MKKNHPIAKSHKKRLIQVNFENFFPREAFFLEHFFSFPWVVTYSEEYFL